MLANLSAYWLTNYNTSISIQIKEAIQINFPNMQTFENRTFSVPQNEGTLLFISNISDEIDSIR